MRICWDTCERGLGGGRTHLLQYLNIAREININEIFGHTTSSSSSERCKIYMMKAAHRYHTHCLLIGTYVLRHLARWTMTAIRVCPRREESERWCSLVRCKSTIQLRVKFYLVLLSDNFYLEQFTPILLLNKRCELSMGFLLVVTLTSRIHTQLHEARCVNHVPQTDEAARTTT